MASDRTFADNADLQGLSGDAIVDLWFVDLQPIDPDIPNNQRFFRFVNYVVADGQPVSFASQQYEPIPYKAEGFEIRTDGVPPNPKLTVSNITLDWTGLVNAWNDLVGARITRRRVLAKHLDGGTDPDGTAHWPDEIWTIQQKTAESKLLVEFTLSTAFDLDGVVLPKRRALRYTCPWIYRSANCGYAGPPVADAEDQPIQSDNQLIQDVSDTQAAIPPVRAVLVQANEDLATAQTNVNAAENELSSAQSAIDNYQGDYVKQEQRYNYNVFSKTGTDYIWENSRTGSGAKWDNNDVSLGEEYRREGLKAEQTYEELYRRPGARYSSYVEVVEKRWEISRWSRDNTPPASYITRRDNAQTALTDAENAETQAEADLATAQADYDAAIAAYETAVIDWQAGGSPIEGDVCGKRINSCSLRYYDPVNDVVDDLPFGGFPGLSNV